MDMKSRSGIGQQPDIPLNGNLFGHVRNAGQAHRGAHGTFMHLAVDRQRAVEWKLDHEAVEGHDVVERPGEQDITAHVDFSALAQAAHEAGLEVLGYAAQAQFLVNCGITEVLARANVENALRYAPIAAEAQVLLSPNEMGELFKVLAVGRGVKQPLAGFSRGDRSHTL